MKEHWEEKGALMCKIWEWNPCFFLDRYMRSKDGYKPQEKKRELFAQQSRFLLLSRAIVDDKAPETIDGFLMWRFDFEECLSVEAGETEVAYWFAVPSFQLLDCILVCLTDVDL